MPNPDLNLLAVLDILLAEGSVAGAAKRLRLSQSAMSRTLARLRKAVDDPLLVRSGRGLVPTPRALALRAPVGSVVEAARAVLAPLKKLELGALDRVFTLRVSDGFAENFGAALIERMAKEAPQARLRFVPKTDRDSSSALREGGVDLETAVIGKATAPELRAQALFRDRFIGVARSAHPLRRGTITAARYAAARHVVDLRHETGVGPIDKALERLDLERNVTTVVGGFATMLALARDTDLVASVPEFHTRTLRTGMWSFALPVPLPRITISMLWHPRLEADQAHRWLRNCVREISASTS